MFDYLIEIGRQLEAGVDRNRENLPVLVVAVVAT